MCGISIGMLIILITANSSIGISSGIIIKPILAQEQVQESITTNNSLTITINDNSNTNQTRFLFVQDADSGSLVPAGNSNDTVSNYRLTMNNVSSTTIAFSDRPQRLVFQLSTESFVNNWTAGQDSFRSDPPNAAIVLTEGGQKGEGIIVGELLNPIYDKENKTLQYDIMNLDSRVGATGEKARSQNVIFSAIGNKSSDLITNSNIPNNFGEVTLFIDAGCTITDPRC